jgi:inorganic pyrophosphatase
VRRLEDVPPHFLREVEHFFATYKQLEGAHTESLGWTGAEEATHEVRASVERFRAGMGTVRM